VKSPERGVALLEVLAALAILSVAGLGLIELVGMQARAAATAAERERELWDQERLVAAHVLLAARDLDLRLGGREVGPYVVIVQRPERDLYRIAVARRGTPGVEDLATAVYRRNVP
jgi:type II secretory pathway component PulJ